MTEILQIYKELFSDKLKWRYYSKMNINPFDSDSDTKDFITRFIELSGKSNDNPLYDNINKLDNKRIRHIVSTFFLGTYIYFNVEPIKDSIDKVISRFKKQNPDSKIEFSFVWFLICLFHDLGYAIEDKEKFNDFDDFIKGKVKYFLNERVGVPAFYESVYENYFNYRLKSRNVCIRKPDHGICGGIILFNKLNEILLRKQANKESEGLYWNQKLINIYRHASWVILCHNIFFIKKGDIAEQEYLDNKLNALILNEKETTKINIKKHGFLYLFMLVDSIDPIKIANTFDSLTNFKFEISNNNLCFEIDDEAKRNDYFKKVLDLKLWLISDIERVDNKIMIKIK